ncbi:DUF881 domain-containing protein [bacterium]|nr:DUF881 domain-containing protein [bacterium]
MNLLHRKKNKSNMQIALLLITGLVLGFIVIIQAKHFTNYIETIGRDSTENVFRRIQILKISNDELKDEISSLETQFEDLNDQAQSFATIDNDIKKDEIIAGETDIFGPGIELTIENNLNVVWFIDLTNELITSGAEAISVNNIRLTNSTMGFDPLPNGQIMINGVILQPPYTFQAIGDKEELNQILTNPIGILNRMNSAIKDFKYEISQKDRIDMKKV